MKRISTFLLFSMMLFAVSATNLIGQDLSAEATIKKQVAKEIKMLHYYGVYDHIDFEVNGDTVVLTGKVRSLGTKRSAANVVKRIDGVSNVVNNIVELPLSGFDDQIRRATLNTFLREGPSQYFWEPNPDVKIIVDRGRVTLEGNVYNNADKNRLNILANGIFGVFGVTNNLVVGTTAG